MATLLFFDADQSALSVAELASLKSWITSSQANSTTKVLVVGGALDSSRAGRLRRLQGIRSVVEGMGISLRFTRTLEDRCSPAGWERAESLPTDVAWIGYRDSPRRTVTPPRLHLQR